MDKFQIFESQAFEFAGRLLVHRDILKKKLLEAKTKAIKAGFDKWDELKWIAIDSIAVEVGRYFGVSDSVIVKRIEKENFADLL